MRAETRMRLAAAALLSATGGATTTQAAVYQVEFIGHLTSLNDTRSVFGGAAIGQVLVADVRVDDGVSMADIRHFIDGYGSQYGVYAPGMSVTMRLNGVTFAIPGSGAVNRVNFLRPGFNSYDGVFTNLSGTPGDPYAGAVFSAFATSTTTDFLEETPFGDFYGSPLDFTTDPRVPAAALGNFQVDYIQGNPIVGTFGVDRIIVSVGDTVPEPATWSLLIAGFAVTGVASRRRSRTIAG